jgi:hypothetical protein
MAWNGSTALRREMVKMAGPFLSQPQICLIGMAFTSSFTAKYCLLRCGHMGYQKS